MSRYDLLLGVVVLGGGAALGACSGSDDGGGSDPTLSTLGKTVTTDAGPDADEGFTPGLGCEGATFPTSTGQGGEITVLTCLNRRMPGTVPR